MAKTKRKPARLKAASKKSGAKKNRAAKKTGKKRGISARISISTPAHPVRYAVLGLGHIAQSAVLPAFAHARSNSQLAALISDSTNKLETLARRYDVPSVYSYDQLEECIETEQIDAVYIALPNSMHRDFALRAARMGSHILCEKPLGLTARECEEMYNSARASNVYLMTAYRLHFDAANMEASRVIQKGAIGEAKIFSSVFSFQVADNNIRLQREMGGGALLDIGIYCINAARYLLKDEPESVSAYMIGDDDPRFMEVEAGCGAIMRFPRNRLAQFSCSFAAGDSSYFEVVGTKGSLRLHNAYEIGGACELEVKVGGKSQRKKFKAHDQFAAELIYFSECILRGTRPEPSALEGLADLAIMDAIRESADQGQSVDLALPRKDLRPDDEQIITAPPLRREPRLVDVAPPSQ